MKQLFILLLVFAVILNGCEDEITENTPPPVVENKLEANAGTDVQAETNQQLVLDGSESKDLDEKPFQFLWSIKSKPGNSQPILTDETTAAPIFTADLTGVYVVELKIFNASFNDVDDVSITVVEQAPPPEQEAGILNTDISQELRLVSRFDDPAIPDYLVPEDIHVTALLMIDPSVTIAFESGKAMYIDNPGSIQALGAGGNGILFTGKEKTPGYWKGLIIKSSSALNKLEYMTIEYAGSTPADGLEFAANLALDNTGNIELASVTIQQSAAYGMVVESGANWSSDSFSNTFKNNHTPLRIPASQVNSVDGLSTFYDNNNNRIEVSSGNINDLMETSWPRALSNRTPASTVPYLVQGSVTVTSGLRIFAGTEILFDSGAELVVAPNGYLTAIGTGEKPIKFHGAESAEGGYWKGIAIKSNNINNELRFVEVYDAGTDILSGFDQKTAIAMDGENHAKLKLTNSKIGKSGGYGLLVENHAQLEAFEFNQFGYNAASAVLMPANEVRKLNTVSQTLTFTGNGHNGVEIFSSSLLLPNNEESVWPELFFGATYLVSGNLSIQSGLKILPGAAFKFADGKGIRVVGNGYLNATGTEARKIIFTGASETKGSWYGIQFLTNSNQNVLDHTEILYAGNGLHYGILKVASLALGGSLPAKLSVTNSKIAHGGGYGIALDINLTTINTDYETANQFEDLTLGNVYKTEQ
jgi:hypothetical protein